MIKEWNTRKLITNGSFSDYDTGFVTDYRDDPCGLPGGYRTGYSEPKSDFIQAVLAKAALETTTTQEGTDVH